MAGKINNGKSLIPTPIWVLVVHVFQIIFSIIIVGAAGWWVHGLYLDPLGFAIICGLFTWIITMYVILSEKVAACQRGYNTWAVLSLEGLMILFWLSAMGAIAAERGTFKYNVKASCVSDGSAINSGKCTVSKRAGVASYAALDVMSAIAGMCAIEMLLFVATFAYVCHMFRLSFNSGKDIEKNDHSAATPFIPNQAGPTEYSTNVPLMNQQPQQQYPQENAKWAEHQNSYAQQPSYPPAAPAYEMTPQSTGYAGASGVYSPDHITQQPMPHYGQQTVSPPPPGVHQLSAQPVLSPPPAAQVYQLPAHHTVSPPPGQVYQLPTHQ